MFDCLSLVLHCYRTVGVWPGFLDLITDCFVSVDFSLCIVLLGAGVLVVLLFFLFNQNREAIFVRNFHWTFSPIINSLSTLFVLFCLWVDQHPPASLSRYELSCNISLCLQLWRYFYCECRFVFTEDVFWLPNHHTDTILILQLSLHVCHHGNPQQLEYTGNFHACYPTCWHSWVRYCLNSVSCASILPSLRSTTCLNIVNFILELSVL